MQCTLPYQGDVAAVVTATEGVAAGTAATAASGTGTACRMSRERPTDQPPHTFAGKHLLSAVHFILDFELTKDENWVQGPDETPCIMIKKLVSMKSDPEVEVFAQGCQLGIHPERRPHSERRRGPGLRLFLLAGSPSGPERTRVRAEQEERRVRRRREESLAELQVTVPACEVKCLR